MFQRLTYSRFVLQSDDNLDERAASYGDWLIRHRAAVLIGKPDDTMRVANIASKTACGVSGRRIGEPVS